MMIVLSQVSEIGPLEMLADGNSIGYIVFRPFLFVSLTTTFQSFLPGDRMNFIVYYETTLRISPDGKF